MICEVIIMLEYLPWAQSTLEKALEKYTRGTFSILDVELGGECNYHCVYCDSPDRKKKCTIPMDAFENLISTQRFDWLFICGLGEPTYNHNYDILLKMLSLCEQYNVKCSIFSNLSNLTPELIHYIEAEVLYIFFKYDSSQTSTVKMLYGIKSAQQQIQTVKNMKKYVRCKDNKTNLAASIVPTQLNYKDIMNIVEECVNANIFPLLGELESSGKGETNYENLCLNSEELKKIKDNTEELLGHEYQIPVCPSVISGIHFSSDSYITVDAFSGLSCHWFWLEEPKVYQLFQFNADSSLTEMTDKILNYRTKRLKDVEIYMRNKKDVGGAFGGCGGKIGTIFEYYLKCHKGVRV